MTRHNVITWTREAGLKAYCKDIKHAARQLHWALESLGVELEARGYTPEQIQVRIRDEFIIAAREVLKEEA